MTTLIQQVNINSPLEDNTPVKPTPYECILVPKIKPTKKEKEDAKQEKAAAREANKQAAIDAKQAKVDAREAKKQAAIDAKQAKVDAREAKKQAMIDARQATIAAKEARQAAARQEAVRVAVRVAARQATRVAREEVLAVRRAARVRESDAWTLYRSAADGGVRDNEYIEACREAWHVARRAIEALRPRAVARAAALGEAPTAPAPTTVEQREAAAQEAISRARRIMAVMEQANQNDDREIRRDRNGASKTQDQLIIVEKAFHAEDCPICFNGITETNVVTLRCGHQTCGDCLFHHFQTIGGTKCPVCREQYVVRVKGWKPPAPVR